VVTVTEHHRVNAGFIPTSHQWHRGGNLKLFAPVPQSLNFHMSMPEPSDKGLPSIESTIFGRANYCLGNYDSDSKLCSDI